VYRYLCKFYQKFTRTFHANKVFKTFCDNFRVTIFAQKHLQNEANGKKSLYFYLYIPAPNVKNCEGNASFDEEVVF
jgi:hypothetical protein